MPIDKVYSEQVRALLNSMPKQAVIDLAKTVTCQKILFTESSVNEAISAIIDFSRSPKELLNRRRMKYEYLFAYLINYCQRRDVEFKCQKQDLIDKILSMWHADSQATEGSSEGSGDSLEDDESSDAKNEQVGGESGATGATESPETKTLATQFLKWWYELLLPFAGCAISEPQAVQFGPQHFFDDCLFHFYCVIDGGSFNHEERIESAARIATRLAEITSSLKMVLNPNLTDSSAIKCFSDPYGLVFIAVTGTLFISPSLKDGDSTLAGVFQQTFGIVQDPLSDNRWRVKSSQLRLSVASRFLSIFENYFYKPTYVLSSGDDRLAIMDM